MRGFKPMQCVVLFVSLLVILHFVSFLNACKEKIHVTVTEHNEGLQPISPLPASEQLDHPMVRDTDNKPQDVHRAMMKWRRLVGELTCQLTNNDGVGPTGGWCLKPTGEMWGKCRAAEHHFSADIGIGRTIIKYLTPPGQGGKIHLLDIGAGVGQYGCFLESENSNIVWQGYDGAENIESFTNNWVKWIDVTDKQHNTIEPPGFVADWIMSLEVGEHISPAATDSLLNLLDRHNRYGIIISWALPGQGGHSHINLKTNSEVIEALGKRGYFQDKWCLDFQTEARNVAVYGWFRHTFMVFKRVLL